MNENYSNKISIKTKKSTWKTFREENVHQRQGRRNGKESMNRDYFGISATNRMMRKIMILEESWRKIWGKSFHFSSLLFVAIKHMLMLKLCLAYLWSGIELLFTNKKRNHCNEWKMIQFWNTPRGLTFITHHPNHLFQTQQMNRNILMSNSNIKM